MDGCIDEPHLREQGKEQDPQQCEHPQSTAEWWRSVRRILTVTRFYPSERVGDQRERAYPTLCVRLRAHPSSATVLVSPTSWLDVINPS